MFGRYKKIYDVDMLRKVSYKAIILKLNSLNFDGK